MKVTPTPQWLDKGDYKEPKDGDNARVPRLEIDDATTYLDKDGSDNMTLTDAVTGTKTLAELSAAGSGDVTGPGSATDNAIVRFDGTGGKTIQDYTSGAPTISDTGTTTIPNDISIDFGASGDSSILYETADANSFLIMLALPHVDEDASNTPHLVIGDKDVVGFDLGTLIDTSSSTEPNVYILDKDKDSWVRLGYASNDAPELRTNRTFLIQSAGAIQFRPNDDSDDYISFTTTTNRPRIEGVGSFLVLGADADTGHSLGATDILVSGALEVDGNVYFDTALTVVGTTTLDTGLTGVLRGDSGVVSVDTDVTKRVIQILVSDPQGDAITTGDLKAYFRAPAVMSGWNLVDVEASLSTASSSGDVTVQVRNVTQSGANILSTAITIEANETDTSTATTAPVIDTDEDDLTTVDQIAIDIDGAGTGAKGLLVELTYQLP